MRRSTVGPLGPPLIVLGAILCADVVVAQPARPDPRPVIQAEPATVAPRIDGSLDDAIWQRPAIATGDWMSYNPLYGDTIPQHTDVWIAYDRDNLYVAFKCDDPDPAGIKTSVARRDNINADDWVGLSLDAMGIGQLSYHMMVNPSGVQLDLLNSVARDEDWTVDWVWQSAGRLTETGYAVEIRLPWRSIRFKSGTGVSMGILFWRRISRAGISVAWPPLEPGKWVFEKHASLTFANLDPRLPIDLIPAVALSERQLRETPERWSTTVGQTDPGVSAKIGLTPEVTLDATVNPDFSQVESDAFQVEVNQRFPVFYSEKRPFFMEGAGIFDVAGSGGDNSLQKAVHTRRIIDPIAGAKLTGTVGRVTFGTLSASDEALGKSLAPDDPNAGRNRMVNIARAQYSLGPSNYVGALVTDTEFSSSRNSVAGSDLSWRVSNTQRLTGFLFGSDSQALATPDSTSGIGANVGYSYSTRKLAASGSVEHYSPGFRMDTAFLNRVGITIGWGYVERNFYPPKERYPWLRRVTPFVFAQGGVDRLAGGNEQLEVIGARFNFTRQGFLRVDRSFGFETWAVRQFPRGRYRAFGNVQLYRWLKLDGRYDAGRAVYYDPIDPFEGRSRSTQAGFTLQPNGQLSQTLSYTHVNFDRWSTGAPVYALDIVNSKTIFQFTRQWFARVIAQYDSSRTRVLTDLLLSYELNPGTVAYVGYGSLIERRDYQDGTWTPGAGDYRATQRGLLLKVSYLFQF
jgi:Domain of unknown function (DUF5916)/Carbohydrate family 9 binding domain-like